MSTSPSSQPDPTNPFQGRSSRPDPQYTFSREHDDFCNALFNGTTDNIASKFSYDTLALSTKIKSNPQTKEFLETNCIIAVGPLLNFVEYRSNSKAIPFISIYTPLSAAERSSARLQLCLYCEKNTRIIYLPIDDTNCNDYHYSRCLIRSLKWLNVLSSCSNITEHALTDAKIAAEANSKNNNRCTSLMRELGNDWINDILGQKLGNIDPLIQSADSKRFLPDASEMRGALNQGIIEASPLVLVHIGNFEDKYHCRRGLNSEITETYSKLTGCNFRALRYWWNFEKTCSHVGNIRPQMENFLSGINTLSLTKSNEVISTSEAIAAQLEGFKSRFVLFLNCMLKMHVSDTIITWLVPNEYIIKNLISCFQTLSQPYDTSAKQIRKNFISAYTTIQSICNDFDSLRSSINKVIKYTSPDQDHETLTADLRDLESEALDIGFKFYQHMRKACPDFLRVI